MTNKEIEKMLNFLDNEKLEELKKYLLSEKTRNNNIFAIVFIIVFLR